LRETMTLSHGGGQRRQALRFHRDLLAPRFAA
jgi:hypothetical protein